MKGRRRQRDQGAWWLDDCENRLGIGEHNEARPCAAKKENQELAYCKPSILELVQPDGG